MATGYGPSGIQWGRTTRSSTKNIDSDTDQTMIKEVNTNDRDIQQGENENKEDKDTSREDERSCVSMESNGTEGEIGLQASKGELKATIDKLTASL